MRRVAGLKKSWLHYLVKHLGGERNQRKVRDNFRRVSFIVFNYDRCIEQYLYWAFQMAGGLSEAYTADAVRAIPIVHAYGQLGTLPLDRPIRGSLAFGDGSRLSVAIANRIRTYTEEARDEELLLRIQGIARGAGKLVFLGFGYHQQNLKLLYPQGVGPVDCQVWGTAIKIPSPSLLAVQDIFKKYSNRGAKLDECDCTSLFSRYHDEIFS